MPKNNYYKYGEFYVRDLVPKLYTQISYGKEEFEKMSDEELELKEQRGLKSFKKVLLNSLDKITKD